MAEKTILEKAAEAVGFGMAMAEDVAGSVKTAVGSAVTTVTEVLTKSPAKKAPVKTSTCEGGYSEEGCQKGTCQEGHEESRDKEPCEEGC